MNERREQCQRHDDQIDYLCRSHDQLNSRVNNIESNTQILVTRQEEIKKLIQDQQDREALKRYVKKISGVIIGFAAVVTAAAAIFTKAKFW